MRVSYPRRRSGTSAPRRPVRCAHREASALAFAALLLVAPTLTQAQDARVPIQNVQRDVSRLQDSQPALRQGLQGLDEIASRLDSTQQKLQTWTTQLETRGGAVDPNALVQSVLRESYLQTTEDLRFFSEKVKSFNATKKAMRDHLARLRQSAQGLGSESRRGALDASLARMDGVAQELDQIGGGLQATQRRLSTQAAQLERLSREPPSGNIQEVIYQTLKESIEATNRDKAYYLKKLQERNKLAETLAASQKALADSAASMAQQEKGSSKDKGSATTKSTGPIRRYP